MKVITKQQLIDTVAKNYKKGGTLRASQIEVMNRLLALKNPTEDQITSIIGNSSWTRNECTECKKDVNVVVELGEEPDYESSTAWLCLRCLQKAVSLALEVGKEND